MFIPCLHRFPLRTPFPPEFVPVGQEKKWDFGLRATIVSREVSVRREGDAVILEPLKPRAWPKGYWRRWGKATLDLGLVEPLAAGGSTIDLDQP